MNSNFLDNSGYKIPLSNISYNKLKNLINDLTVVPRTMMSNEQDDENTKFKLYKICDKYITVPKFYGIEKFGTPEIQKYNPVKSDMKFTSELRDYQIPIVNKCMEYLNKNNGGLLSIPCGMGKTTMALKMACELGLKTLVVVHKSFLLDQWKQRIKQFTNAKIGIIRQNTVNVKNKDIVIALIQSLSRRKYEKQIFKEFGTVIYDESHHCASKHFSKALAKTAVKYTIGLSATPYRSDGLIKVMHWYLGKVMFRIKMKCNDQVVSKIINYHSTSSDYKNRKRFIKGEMRSDCVKMETYLIENENRNNHLINIIDTLRKNNKRKILILSGRKKHLSLLKKAVDKLIKKDIDNEIIKKDQCITQFYTGDLNQQQREYAEKNGDIFFGTYNMAHEGLDIERLNTIILATPKKDIVQSIGRILRKVLVDGDQRPLIIDFKDSLEVYNNQGNKREIVYRKGTYNLEHYCIIDNKIVDNKIYKKDVGIDSKINKNIDFCSNIKDVLSVTKVKLNKNYILDHLKIIDNDVDDDDSDNDENNRKIYTSIAKGTKKKQNVDVFKNFIKK